MLQGMEYVYAVYQEKSFSKAAEKLFISQPSLSANIKRIEKRIGFPLFDRSCQPIELTEVGHQYIQQVERIQAITSDFQHFLNDYAGLSRGHLSLGGSSFYASLVLPPMLANFAQQFPGIKLELSEEITEQLPVLLNHNEIDLVIENGDMDLNLFDRRLYCEEHLLLAVPSHYEINHYLLPFQIDLREIQSQSFTNDMLTPVGLHHFKDLPFILLKQENDTGLRARQICQQQAFTPNIAFEVDQQLTAYNITTSGLGISFLGDRLISVVPSNDKVVYYKLAGPSVRRQVYFYWKKNRYMSKAMQTFLDLICPK